MDYLPDVLQAPDYVGYVDDVVELVKLFKDDIFVSVKLDSSIETNVKSGRWKKLDEVDSFYIQVYSYWLQRGCVKLIKRL